jgi:hypothetical protein
MYAMRPALPSGEPGVNRDGLRTLGPRSKPGRFTYYTGMLS